MSLRLKPGLRTRVIPSRALYSVLALLFCLSWTAIGLTADRLATVRMAMESIRAEGLQSDVNYLADDAREGREAGSAGGWAAGNYLIANLSKIGLRKAGTDGGYVQTFAPNYRNILALIQGSDPKLNDEMIVVGAHYDHVGYGRPGNSRGPIGKIHNGADDNASGTSGLLSLARASALLPETPRRSVLLAFFDGEEKGLLGSKYWVAHPTLPDRHAVLMVNMDMIGRLRQERLTVFGVRTGYGLRKLVSSDNEESALALDFCWDMRPDADHFPFYQKNTPVLMFHTGLHEQYHRPSDKANLINSDGMQQVMRLVFRVVYDEAEIDRVTSFRASASQEKEATKKALTERLSPLPQHPLRVGITWRVDDAEPGVVIITRVIPDSPAAKAGLMPEDRICGVDGRDFRDDTALGNLLKTLPGPIRLSVERDGKLRAVEIHFQAAALPRAA
ncbi:MAG: M28 family peptidase [Thermoguttaceae bacterium]